MSTESGYGILFNIFKNVIRMLEFRGYDIGLDNFNYGDEQNYLDDLDNLTYDKFIECIQKTPKNKTPTAKIYDILEQSDALDFRHRCSNIVFNEDDNKIAIFFFAVTDPGKSRTSKEELALAERIKIKMENQYRKNDKTIFDYIYISQENINLVKPSEIKEYEMWKDSYFRYVPSKNIYAGKYELLSVEKTKELLKNTTVNINELPKIHLNDIMNKYHGGKLGQVYKVTNINLIPNSMCQTIVNYRVVIGNNVEKNEKKIKKNDDSAF